VFVCVRVCMCACMHVRAHAFLCVCVCICVGVIVCVCIYVCVEELVMGARHCSEHGCDLVNCAFDLSGVFEVHSV